MVHGSPENTQMQKNAQMDLYNQGNINQEGGRVGVGVHLFK